MALNVKGLLFDLDGVLYVDSQPIPGAIDAIAKLRASGMPCRFITNTSTLSLASLQKKLVKLGFDIPAQEIISAPQAALAPVWLPIIAMPARKIIATSSRYGIANSAIAPSNTIPAA